MFKLSESPIDPAACAEALANDRAGALVTFEGWVRNHNDGRPVEALSYEAFGPMAVAEGEKLLSEAKNRFAILDAHVVHRTGPTVIGDRAVWVGVTAEHRQEAFLAGRWIMDEIKRQVPIWKKETYADAECSEWVNTTGAAENDSTDGMDVVGNPHYSRQVRLKDFGVEGQLKLARAKILVVGAGGLGCPALQYLAAAGVGFIRIADGDAVDVTNLHRQILFGNSDIGRNKAEAAAGRLRDLNPHISLEAVADAVYVSTLADLIKDVDLVLDCTDGFESKYLISDVCWNAGLPVVQASVHQYDGWVQIVDPEANAGCYRCQWPEAPPVGCVGTCAEAGVIGVTPGTLGVLQAAQAIAYLTGHTDALTGSTLYMDVLSGRTQCIKRQANPSCSCGRTTSKPEESLNVLLPGKRAMELAREATIIDIREPRERIGNPDWIQQIPNVPHSEWGSILDRFNDRPIILCCAAGIRTRACLAMLGNPDGVYAWSKSISEVPLHGV
jgi:adenylyltransferase/sulfurtransferase